MPIVWTGHDSWIWALASRPVGDAVQLVSGSEDRTVRIWSTTTDCFQAELQRDVERRSVVCERRLDDLGAVVSANRGGR